MGEQLSKRKVHHPRGIFETSGACSIGGQAGRRCQRSGTEPGEHCENSRDRPWLDNP